MLRTSKGRKEAAHNLAAWISARSHAIPDAKFLRPRKFSKISVRNRTQSHAPQHADTRHRCCGPLRVVSKLRTTWRHGFRRDLARFRTQNFCGRENFRKILSEIRSKSHEISRAAACRRSAQCPRTSEDRGKAVRRRAARISARFRTRNFAIAKMF